MSPSPIAGPGSDSSSKLGIVSLLLSLAGCIFFPIAAVASSVFFHGTDTVLTAITAFLGVGAVSVLAAIVLAIVALARGKGGKVTSIVALVFALLSIPAGIAGGFFALIFASPGAHGRPFRAGGKERSTPIARGDAWSSGGPTPSVEGLDATTRAELAERWLADAALEHASIAAFSSLALDLVALGAPPDLVRRAHEAAIDEIGHAQTCFAIASAYAGYEITAAAFPEVVEPRPRETRAELLRRVAVESAVDGWIGEGSAAADAKAMAARSEDPVIATALERIAREEARHAALGRDVVSFCLAQSSLVSERDDRIERSRTARGEEAERDAGGRARSHRDGERERIQLHRPPKAAAQEGDRA